MTVQYKVACNFSKKVIFQNTDDRDEFVSKKIVDMSKTEIINGSGVNLEKFEPKPLPSSPVFLMISRLIKDKGIIEYLLASEIVKEKYQHARFLLVGPYDSNPSAIKESELLPFIKSGSIEYFGEQDCVQPFIEMSNVFVLPSYHEGTPFLLLD
jgi:glycosyltransferase involved in cell wall biosynthesis